MKHPMKPRVGGVRHSATPNRGSGPQTRALKRLVLYFAIGVAIIVIVYLVFVKWVHHSPADHPLTLAPEHLENSRNTNIPRPPIVTAPSTTTPEVHDDAVRDEHHPPILKEEEAAVVVDGDKHLINKKGSSGVVGAVVEQPPKLAGAALHYEIRRLGEEGHGILNPNQKNSVMNQQPHNEEMMSQHPRPPKTFSERLEMARKRHEVINAHKREDYRHLSLPQHHEDGSTDHSDGGIRPQHGSGDGGIHRRRKPVRGSQEEADGEMAGDRPRRRMPGGEKGHQQHMEGGKGNAHDGNFGGMGLGAFEAAGAAKHDSGDEHQDPRRNRRKRKQQPQGMGDHHQHHPERRANHQFSDGQHHGLYPSEAADILRHNHDEHRRKIEEKAHREEMALHHGSNNQNHHSPMNPLEYRRKNRGGKKEPHQQHQHLPAGVLNETEIVEERRLQAERLMKVIDGGAGAGAAGSDHGEAEMKIHAAMAVKKAEAAAAKASAEKLPTPSAAANAVPVASVGEEHSHKDNAVNIDHHAAVSVAEWESHVDGGAEGLAAAREYFYTHISAPSAKKVKDNTNGIGPALLHEDSNVNNNHDDHHQQDHDISHNNNLDVATTHGITPTISEVITRLKEYAAHREHKHKMAASGVHIDDDTGISNGGDGGGIERTIIGALVVTVDGPILWKYHPDVAPRTVANFIRMSSGHHGKEDAAKRAQAAAQLSPEKEFAKMDLIAQNTSASNSVYFHSCFYRYEQGFVLQGGLHCRQSPPNARGGKNVPLEYSIPNTKYTVALARAGADIRSGGSEFFINLRDNSGTLSKKNKGGYAVFASVVVEHEQTLQTIVKMKKRPVQKGGSTTAFGSPQPTILWIETLFA